VRSLIPVVALLAAVPASAGSLVGKVVDKASRAPHPKVEVHLMDLKLVTRTDAEGRFRFLDLTEGLHALSVEELGFQPWMRNVEVEEADTSRVEVDMDSAPVPAVLAGRVTSRNGSAPVPHAHVAVAALGFDVQADDAGNYWMFNVRPGRYEVKAVA